VSELLQGPSSMISCPVTVLDEGIKSCITYLNNKEKEQLEGASSFIISQINGITFMSSKLLIFWP
jgi:hypothetical protein